MVAAIQLALILQQVTHLPFVYYIAKESLLTSIDEIINSTLSKMIYRIRLGDTYGDFRYFLTQLKIVREKDVFDQKKMEKSANKLLSLD